MATGHPNDRSSHYVRVYTAHNCLRGSCSSETIDEFHVQTYMLGTREPEIRLNDELMDRVKRS